MSMSKKELKEFEAKIMANHVAIGVDELKELDKLDKLDKLVCDKGVTKIEDTDPWRVKWLEEREIVLSTKEVALEVFETLANTNRVAKVRLEKDEGGRI